MPGAYSFSKGDGNINADSRFPSPPPGLVTSIVWGGFSDEDSRRKVPMERNASATWFVAPEFTSKGLLSAAIFVCRGIIPREGRRMPFSISFASLIVIVEIFHEKCEADAAYDPEDNRQKKIQRFVGFAWSLWVHCLINDLDAWKPAHGGDAYFIEFLQ